MLEQYNPSLRKELRYRSTPIIPSKPTESLLDWLKRTGRLKAREIDSSLKEKNEMLEELENIIDETIYSSEEE